MGMFPGKWRTSYCPRIPFEGRTPDQEDHIILYTSRDEKWFYCIKTRTNAKEILSLGIEAVDFHAQHKSHIGKTMYLCQKALLFEGNDVTRGSTCKACRIAMIRIGREEPATKNS